MQKILSALVIAYMLAVGCAFRAQQPDGSPSGGKGASMKKSEAESTGVASAPLGPNDLGNALLRRRLHGRRIRTLRQHRAVDARGSGHHQ